MKLHSSLAFIVLSSLFLGIHCKPKPKEVFISNAFDHATKQWSVYHLKPADSLKIPRSINNDGSLHAVKPGDWTCGFFPGSLWYVYEFTKDEAWKKDAENWTEILENVKNKKTTHDLGFMLYCSYGNGYRLTQNDKYKNIMLEGAQTLSLRFNPNIGCIKSWDRWPWSAKWQYPVIIDNMMNLEYLFWATKASGDSSFYKIAKTHALTTMKNHFRSDYSSYHVVDYDSISGKVISKGTHQGIADESSWARGQGWGLYGYTMCYRETKDTVFLNHAKKIASYILNFKGHPEDMIFYWDFKDPSIPKAPRDASAAALIASALLELSSYDKENQNLYINTAEKILTNLASKEYTAEVGSNHYFLLKHSTGNYPANSEIDAPLSYADYYYLEALLRLKNIRSTLLKK